MSPQRVKVEGDLFHGRVPDGAIYVGRAAPGLKASRYANPFRVGHRSTDPRSGHEVIVVNRAQAVELYEATLESLGGEWAHHARAELLGRDLACWCPLDQACHGDALLRFVTESTP